MMRGLVAVIALAACSNPPPLTIDYALASQQQVCTAAQGGTATSCSDVALPCDTYLLLDIVDPNAPAPENLEHQVFQPVTGRRDLCSIAGIDLGTGIELPDKTVTLTIQDEQVLIHIGDTDIKVSKEEGVSLTSKKPITISTEDDLSIKAKNVKIESDSDTNITASGKTTVKGSTIDLNP